MPDLFVHVPLLILCLDRSKFQAADPVPQPGSHGYVALQSFPLGGSICFQTLPAPVSVIQVQGLFARNLS
jgi:hypothetical protein